MNSLSFLFFFLTEFLWVTYGWRFIIRSSQTPRSSLLQPTRTESLSENNDSSHDTRRPIKFDVTIYLSAKRRGDKFDRSMTRGKLLGNNALLFIFISILIMTQLISFLWKNENKKFTRLTAVRTGGLGLLPVR